MLTNLHMIEPLHPPLACFAMHPSHPFLPAAPNLLLWLRQRGKERAVSRNLDNSLTCVPFAA
jgi:hypothetical protein